MLLLLLLAVLLAALFTLLLQLLLALLQLLQLLQLLPLHTPREMYCRKRLFGGCLWGTACRCPHISPLPPPAWLPAWPPFPPRLQKLSRKLVHTLAGPGFLACWPLFGAAPYSRFIAALVPSLNCLRLLLIGNGIVKDERAVAAMSRTGDPKELLRWVDGRLGAP